MQNEINCINDSRDFQDAESARSGQSHVASQPVSFQTHPSLGGMLSRSVGMPSRREGPPSIWDMHGESGNVFADPQHLILKNCINGIRQPKSRSIRPKWRKVKDQNKIKIRDANQDREPKVQSSLVEETLRIMVLTNNDCRFQILILTNSPRQLRLLAG